MEELKQAINNKAEERNSVDYINNYKKYLTDILESPDMQKIWNSYREKYIYANDKELTDMIKSVEKILS
ncbi:MAG TPA: hypothetical protein VEF53_15470 [Patescibacteria group bacterium]|nr:hypothetical protein [Patescibacteria group bacterium]